MKFLVVLASICLLGSVTLLELKRTTVTSQSQYMNRYKWPVRGVHSKANDWGGGRTIYLDRHRSDCDIGAISQFHYVRKKAFGKWTRFRYDTVCLMPTNCVNKCPASIRKLDQSMCKEMNTRPNILGVWGGLATNYLDRHYVKCPPRFVLTSFKMVTKNQRIHYNYKCCPSNITNCKSYNTKLQSYGNFSTIYLDRQVVKVPNVRTMAMTGFRLLANYKKKGFYYHVDYCDLRGR